MRYPLCLLLPLLLATLVGTGVAAPRPDGEVAGGGTWVHGADANPPWASEELKGLEREVVQRLDHDRFPQALSLRPEQQERLDALRVEARGLIAEQVRQASEELLAAWRGALREDQWTGFSMLPALHDRGPRELRDVLRLGADQLQAMQRAQKDARARLKAWRPKGLRDWLREVAKVVVDDPQQRRLDTWKRLAGATAVRRRRVVQGLGEQVAAVIDPHVQVILSAEREEAWERFELFEGLSLEQGEARDAELLERFRAAQAARAEAVAKARAALRELSGPGEVARLVGLGLLD